jgi:hypothetical protein
MESLSHASDSHANRCDIVEASAGFHSNRPVSAITHAENDVALRLFQ